MGTVSGRPLLLLLVFILISFSYLSIHNWVAMMSIAVRLIDADTSRQALTVRCYNVIV